MNALKEVPHPDAIEHAIEVLRACFDHPEADEAIAGLALLVEQARWAHHTPKLLTEADAAADLAGVARPGAEPVAWSKDTGKKIRITHMDMRGEDGWRPLFYSVGAAQKGKP